MLYSCTHMATVGIKGLSYGNAAGCNTEGCDTQHVILTDETCGWRLGKSNEDCAELNEREQSEKSRAVNHD